MLPDKDNIANYLNKDKEYLSEKFNEYCTFLTQKKQNPKFKEDDKKKYSVSLDNLKYVSSKTNPVVSFHQKVKNKEDVDIQKLIAIQKGQKQVYEKRFKKNEILSGQKFSKLIDNEIKFEEKNKLNLIKNEILRTTKFKENILVLS